MGIVFAILLILLVLVILNNIKLQEENKQLKAQIHNIPIKIINPDIDIIDAEIKNLILNGELIKAIKRYKDISGVGLKEAKDYIDSLNKELNKF